MTTALHTAIGIYESLMEYSKQERERYNSMRLKRCEKLGLTVTQYNFIRRQGELLRGLYEQNCNGTISEKDYDAKTKAIENKLIRRFPALTFFFQTDPRGATVYAVTGGEINSRNYSSVGVCVY